MRSRIVTPNRTDNVDTGSPHWYISYNDRDTLRYGSDTTALVLGQFEYFLILSGDHRNGFIAAIASDRTGGTTRLSRCLAYVRDNRAQLNPFSNPLI